MESPSSKDPSSYLQSRIRRIFGTPAPGVEMAPWRATLHEVMFEADTPAGKKFDVVLLWLIIFGVILVMLETVESINTEYGHIIRVFEWVVTVIFTVEYALRLMCVYRPMAYATSFFGVVDLLALIPTYLSLFVAGTHVLLVVRVLRVLRFFRLFKLSRFVSEAEELAVALVKSARKIAVFLGFVSALVLIMGASMYLVEGGQGGFTSIPRTMYWAVVTLTTVGYGDIAPQTPLGQFLASAVMMMGYAIIAVPTGIVSAELVGSARAQSLSTQSCPHCMCEAHVRDAIFCQRCGNTLQPRPGDTVSSPPES